MNKKFIYIWIIVILLELFLVLGLKSACVDFRGIDGKGGGCGYWFFVGNNPKFYFSNSTFSIFILLPIIIGAILSYLWRK